MITTAVIYRLGSEPPDPVVSRNCSSNRNVAQARQLKSFKGKLSLITQSLLIKDYFTVLKQGKLISIGIKQGARNNISLVAMDSNGAKVIVCDTGTDVSLIICYTVVYNTFCQKKIILYDSCLT